MKFFTTNRLLKFQKIFCCSHSVFGLRTALYLFEPSEICSMKLQKVDISVIEAVKCAFDVVSLIESCRTEQSFSCLYAACVNEAERLKLDPPVRPRQRRIPARLLDGGSQPVIFHDPQSRCRQKYYEFLETAAAAIRSRYNQAGFQMCIKIETMLKSALSQQMEHDQAVEHRTQVEKDLNDICQHYGDDLEPRKLMRQLEVLRDVCRDQQINTVRDVCLCLMKFSCMYDEVFSEVSRLIRLFLVIPATSATAERSFSTLRRLKIYMIHALNNDCTSSEFLDDHARTQRDIRRT
jgi:hypothetical protein